jgi:hypothetical protein
MGGGNENSHRENVHTAPWQFSGYKAHQRTGQQELFDQLRSATMPINEQYCKRPPVERRLLVELTRLREKFADGNHAESFWTQEKTGVNAYQLHIHLPLRPYRSVCGEHTTMGTMSQVATLVSGQ